MAIVWKILSLDDFRNNVKKNNLRGHFGEWLDELLNRLWSLCRYFINSMCSMQKNLFFKG